MYDFHVQFLLIYETKLTKWERNFFIYPSNNCDLLIVDKIVMMKSAFHLMASRHK